MTEQLDANTQQEDSIVLPGQLDKNNTAEVETESSPVSEENHEQKSNGVQERINKLTAKNYQIEREKNAEIAALQQQLQQKPQQETKSDLIEPVLPEDIYDEDEMRKYYAASSKYNQQVAQSNVNAALETQKQQKAQNTQQAKQQEIVNGYVGNAQRDGVDLDKLRAAENTVNQAGIDNSLAQHIMADNHGGKIVEFLHDNPAMLHELTSMSPMAAAIKIANDIKPQVLSQTPKVSNAPAPQSEVRGGGVHEQDEFEKNYPGATFI